MTDLPEFAEEYTVRERVRICVLGLVVGGVFVMSWKLWLLPRFGAFVASAPCRSVFGVSAVAVLWYGVFVGLPVLCAVPLACIEGRRGLKILRDGQSPPKGAKVLRPTRIKRGAAARRIGYLSLLSFVPLLAVAAWGFFQAESLSRLSQHKPPTCAANIAHANCGLEAALRSSRCESGRLAEASGDMETGFRI